MTTTAQKIQLWAYLQAGKVVAVLFFAPIYWWIVVSANSPPWTYYCISGSWGCSSISPYGLLWYAFYRSISFSLDYWQLIISLCAFDSLVMWLIVKKTSTQYAVLYYLSSWFFLYWSPSDALVFWFGGLSRLRKPLILLAFATKFPIGTPLWVWSYIFNVSLSPHNLAFWFNVVRYPLLGLWMIEIVVQKIVEKYQIQARITVLRKKLPNFRSC